MRAIFSREISLGHSTSHDPVLVQFPNPSSSIISTIFLTLETRSTWPCGSKASCEIFAETKSIAEEFLQDATQAPHPIQAAASKAASASVFGIGIEFASTALPVFTDIYPPEATILSKADRSTTRSFTTGNDAARHGSTTIVSPSLKKRMCSWQVVVPLFGP